MKTSFTLIALAGLLAAPLPAQTNSWLKTEHTLARLHGTNVVWQIVADPAQGKPYFHPLATPDGTLLTALRPAGHPWHRGLWFSWKHLNGLNYWEEDHETGRSEGATELTKARLQPHDDGSATLQFSLTYHPWNAPPVLTEQRTIEISAPTNGSYAINWTSEFTAVTNVILTRTPLPGEPDGQSYGGYAGLSLRLNKAAKGWTFTNSAGASAIAAVHGKSASWMKLTAGPNLPAVVIFDDPRNNQHPVPWYANQGMPFFSPSPLFAKTLTLIPGEKMRLRYRLLITDHDSSITPTSK